MSSNARPISIVAIGGGYDASDTRSHTNSRNKLHSFIPMGRVIPFFGGEGVDEFDSSLDAWAEFDKMVDSITENLNLTNFTRCQLGRELANFEEV